MRIQNNIPAMNTHRVMGINNTNMAKSLEKLSSGYRINRAGDDAAGLAISEKMRAQIRGLTMASKNSSDAISLVQTAEGALQSTHDILQRMRELAVQAASDTNEQNIDRGALNQEFEALKKEIDDISTTTRFNDQNLLDGTFQKVRSTLDNVVSELNNVNALSVARAKAGVYDMTVISTQGESAALVPGSANPCRILQDGVDNMIAMSDKVSDVTFSGLMTGDHNGNIYTLQVEGASIDKMTFRLVDTNGQTVATKQNVDASKWKTGTGTAAAGNTVSFDGVGTFTFELSDTIKSVKDLTSMSGAEIEFVTNADYYTKTLDTTGLAPVGTDVQDAINAALGAGSGTGQVAISFVGNTKSSLSLSNTLPNDVKLIHNVDANGLVTASIVDATNPTKVLATNSASATGIAANGSNEIDLGAYGKLVIKNTSAVDATALDQGTTVYSGAGTGLTQTVAPTDDTASPIDLATATLAIGSHTAPVDENSTFTYDVTVGGVTGTITGTMGGGAANWASSAVTATLDLGNYGTYTFSLAAGTAGNAAGVIAWVQGGLQGIGNLTITPPAAATPITPPVAADDSGAFSATTFSATAAPQKGGSEQVTTSASRAFLTLTINGESINLYKGDTYANFSGQGIAFEFDALSDADIANASYFTALGQAAGTATIAVNANEGAALIIQAGANQGDELGINIDRISTETLGIAYSNLSTQKAASQAITEVNTAINKVSTQRAALGALQNRLEFKIANLDTSAENLQSAESRIRDVDMAKEMMNFTKSNILAQAATAMMAQANSMPQNVLQLLR